MVKSGHPVILVDSIEKAVKFYTEKLGFDLVDLFFREEDNRQFLHYALVRKGKCFIHFRLPAVAEMAEFSMIKHCSGRGVGVYVEMKKGFEKYFERCNKKGVSIADQPKKQPWGHITFSVKDPFGVRLTFAQALDPSEIQIEKIDFCGMKITQKPATKDAENDQIEEMIRWLKGFGILRRVAKKYARLWLKEHFGLHK